MSALMLDFFANKVVVGVLGVGASAVGATLYSAVMASSVSFQFYHIPPMFSSTFGEYKAVCLPFLENMVFLLSGPIFLGVGRIVCGGVFGKEQ